MYKFLLISLLLIVESESRIHGSGLTGYGREYERFPLMELVMMHDTYTSLISSQNIHIVPSFTLECGAVLKDAPVAYKTWGTLNDKRDNVMVICHAFTGSADVEDWWGPMMGRGKAFDPHRFFILCANTLGSPYGSASPVTINPDTGRVYGPEFPPTTIRDDIRIHKHLLDTLLIASIAVVVGGSMGGMTALEWGLCTMPGYVRRVIPLATSARHSAWCISWGEAQRQSIYSDPEYQGGRYCWDDDGEKKGRRQPKAGLAAARMTALLTYRSRDSFESRFGRRPQVACHGPAGSQAEPDANANSNAAVAVHNDGLRPSSSSKTQTQPNNNSASARPQIFSAQSYLRYQGEKFTARFDANCYIHITRKMDTHDVARGRQVFVPSSSSPSSSSCYNDNNNDDSSSSPTPTHNILSLLPPHALIISIASDGLFTPHEQAELAEHIPGAELVTIESRDGHDGFLLEFERINEVILGYLRREFPGVYERGGIDGEDGDEEGDFVVRKTSVFGEAEGEVDVTRW